jgi:hypothetical protein
MLTPTIIFSAQLLAAASTLIAQPDEPLKPKPFYFQVNECQEEHE